MLPIAREIMLRRQREIINLSNRRRRAFFRNQQSAFLLPDPRFKELFRLDKGLIRQLINMIRPHVPHRELNRGISVDSMVLCSLRFYATGSYQRCVGEECNFGMAQSTVHKYIHLITNIIERYIVPEKIVFPITEQERDEIKTEFLQRWGFPGTIGAIDGTHIAILKPREEEYNFVNRKGFHSLNVQVICDHNLKFRNVFANYGGSTHDSFIWRNSAIQNYMIRISANERSWLIGDSGYPLSPYLMTPFGNPGNEGEENYNRAHIAARNCIERAIGVLKMRFRCLLRERTARYSPTFVAKLVKVCAALHNMCIENNMEFADFIRGNDVDEPPADGQNAVHGAGQEMRDLIVNNYFR